MQLSRARLDGSLLLSLRHLKPEGDTDDAEA